MKNKKGQLGVDVLGGGRMSVMSSKKEVEIKRLYAKCIVEGLNEKEIRRKIEEYLQEKTKMDKK